MLTNYTLLASDTFNAQFAALPQEVQIEMSAEIMKLKVNPMNEPVCEALIGDMEGVWRIHVGYINHVLYCVAYIVCADCEARHLETQLGCLDCYNYHWYHVKLVLCGRRDEFYDDLKSCWQSWTITANEIDLQE